MIDNKKIEEAANIHRFELIASMHGSTLGTPMQCFEEVVDAEADLIEDSFITGVPSSPPRASCIMVKMLDVLKRLRLLEKPIAAMLTVYSPVLTMMPARMLSTPSRVCKKAVTKPEQTPAAIAAGRASTGWPARVTLAPTAQPSTKQPSVERSAMPRML